MLGNKRNIVRRSGRTTPFGRSLSTRSLRTPVSVVQAMAILNALSRLKNAGQERDTIDAIPRLAYTHLLNRRVNSHLSGLF
jgi:hypothetical protein